MPTWRDRLRMRLDAHHRPLVLLMVGLVLSMGLAGCTEPPASSTTLLQASHRVGDDLYSWGDPEFTKPFGVGSERRIRAEFTVPADVERVGVAFRGSFVWPDNSTARFEITDPGGNTHLALNATKGRTDDQGEIGSFWQFRPLVDLRPGVYRMVASGAGYIGHLEFQVHGIPRFQTSINETFTVEEAGRDVTLELHVQGWGRTPHIVLRAPDGDRIPVDITSADDQTRVTFPGEAGTYHLDVDTTSWGGRFVAQARH